jgi:predicted negative regulator of RcsB-dependent stress response
MNISEELSPVADWWKKEGKRCVVILCVGALIALGAYAWVSRERRLDAEASVYAYGVTQYTIQELEDAVQKYGDRDVGSVIKMRLANMYYQGAEFEKALEIFKAVADGDVYTVFALAPKFGIARCEEALENWGEAQKAYDEIAETEGGESIYGFNAKLGSARCYALAHIGEEGRFEKLEAIRKECENDVEKRSAVDMMMALLRNYDPKREYVSKEADAGAPAEVTEPKTEAPAAEEKAKAPVKAEKAPAEVRAEAPAKTEKAPAETKKADDKKPAAQPAKAK